ncbi:pirin family protein [Fictibacillus barbaricus]|uniref:Pirin family protein n=1 Tax=Fictibacillus barbaricus TaxID=182136 RepID=A0ABS2ZBZ5_9BACL|nr:pirin family protein [Fictibacillus barbaricus]MBN3544151.1 pirin family protein [Fictibacillus barbaricus]GGB69342.1 hypothetical protein GCM10007199_39440 [Fictibacillus barbaricus]
MKITIFSEEQQGRGQFDGGKITELKPIAFPHEETAVKRVGPLFYWAWGFSETGGLVPQHPHRAFEIMSYMINGNVAHKDTLGTRSVVGPGGAQVMQTGTGIEHEEESFGKDVEGFQIWFEPNLKESIRMKPTYHQFEHEDFPYKLENGNGVKTVIGDNSPITLVTEVKMFDITQEPGKKYLYNLPAHHSIAALVIRGDGSLVDVKNDQETRMAHKDFIVVDADMDSEILFKSNKDGMRIVIIEVPTVVEYPLYQK